MDRPAGNDAQILWRIIRLCLRYRGRVAIAVGATVIAALFQLAVPPLLGSAVDDALALLGTGDTTAEAARTALDPPATDRTPCSSDRSSDRKRRCASNQANPGSPHPVLRPV